MRRREEEEEKNIIGTTGCLFCREEGPEMVAGYASDVELQYSCMETHESIFVICYSLFRHLR